MWPVLDMDFGHERDSLELLCRCEFRKNKTDGCDRWRVA